jgi:hypothetical protein
MHEEVLGVHHIKDSKITDNILKYADTSKKSHNKLEEEKAAGEGCLRLWFLTAFCESHLVIR